LGAAAIADPNTRTPRRPASSDELDAQIARTAPAVLALLADGTPRGKKAILAALAARHPRRTPSAP